ncbi:MAG: type II toxin-antitoxin system prevent-host-death family antitoxin [Clostridia bacterium]|nr:type II toxin-antitoxin system prevent-host-death family antitoxin [Clostridia bacterium]
MTTVTATDVQNNFGKYLQLVQTGEEVIILRNGREMARLISRDKSVSFLTDSLAGVLTHDYDDKQARTERMTKYEGID